MNELSVHIDRLVLNGASGEALRNRDQLGHTTAVALRDLFNERGVPRGLADKELREITAAPISLPDGASHRQIARELANHVYRVLGGCSQKR